MRRRACVLMWFISARQQPPARSLAQEVLKVELLISLSLWIFNYNFVDKPGVITMLGAFHLQTASLLRPVDAGWASISPLEKKTICDGCREEGVNFDQRRWNKIQLHRQWNFKSFVCPPILLSYAFLRSNYSKILVYSCVNNKTHPS